MNREFDIFGKEAVGIWKDFNSEVKNPEGKVIKHFGTSKEESSEQEMDFDQWLKINNPCLKARLDCEKDKELQREIWEQTYCLYLSDVFKLPATI